MSSQFVSAVDLIYGVTLATEWKCLITDGDSSMDDVKDLKELWLKKYPDVTVFLASNPDKTEFRGTMISSDHNIDITANTIGSLIEQGEAFLRKVG